MVPSRLLPPISDNREPPAAASGEVARRIISGTEEAVAAIARIEGRQGDHKRAAASGNAVQSTGTGSNPNPATGGGGGSGRPTSTQKLV